MKILHSENDLLKIAIDNVEDLWHLSKVVEPGNIAEASTFRTVKFGDKEDKKKVFISINVEKVEFAENTNQLRLLGKIIKGSPEDLVQLGKYHTISVEPGSKISIIKKWKPYDLKRLKEAQKETNRPKIRMIVMDDEHALLAELLGSGLHQSHEIRNHASKNDDKYDEKIRQYFGDILKEIESHEEKYVVAGPGFFKDNFRDFIKSKNQKILSRLIFESCSYAEISGFDELLKKGTLEKILAQERLQQEAILMEQFMTHVGKDDGFASYGIRNVYQAAQNFAIENLLVLDSFLRTSIEAQKIFETCEKAGTKTFIFSSDSSYGIRLKGFGGIVAILRFR